MRLPVLFKLCGWLRGKNGIAGRPGRLAEQRAKAGEQGEEFASPLFPEGRVDAGEVEFVGGRELGDVVTPLRFGEAGVTGEPVMDVAIGIRQC
ncbi:hypothetical protein ACFZBP_37945 [Streptomyces sp. NPDC008086]|uniref:hypothetical protein n=1 Tax=Streptomyces sp. NPDC008086 TaxID=3364807 RepID=UPI0036EC92D5